MSSRIFWHNSGIVGPFPLLDGVRGAMHGLTGSALNDFYVDLVVQDEAEDDSRRAVLLMLLLKLIRERDASGRRGQLENA